MPEGNADIVRALIEAYNRRDVEAFFLHAAPRFELDLSRAVGPLHGIYGLEEARQLLDEFADSWEGLRIETNEIIAAAEHVVTPLTMHAQGRDGIEVPSRVTWVWTFQDGQLTRATMYQERVDALAAVGLSN